MMSDGVMNLDRVTEAIEVVASGGSSLDLSDIKALRVIVHFAIDAVDLLANGQRVEPDYEAAAAALYHAKGAPSRRCCPRWPVRLPQGGRVPVSLPVCPECVRTPGRVRMVGDKIVSDALGWRESESSVCPACGGSGVDPEAPFGRSWLVRLASGIELVTSGKPYDKAFLRNQGQQIREHLAVLDKEG